MLLRSYSSKNSPSGIVPASIIDFIEATEGKLTLSSPPKPHRIMAVKVDAAGVAAFKADAGALFNGQPVWELKRQYEWAIFLWDGTAWNVLSAPKTKSSQLVDAGAH
jgi:hypothetical protein